MCLNHLNIIIWPPKINYAINILILGENAYNITKLKPYYI